MDTENVVEENIEVVDTVENNDEMETSLETNLVEEQAAVEEQVIPEVEPVKTFTQDEVNAMIKARVDRQTRKYNQELDQYKKLQTYSQKLFEANDLNETLSKIENKYQELGADLPEFESFQADRETQILAKADAAEIIELGELETAEAYKTLRQIPESRKTKRDKIMEDILYDNLNSIEQERTFVKKGGDKEILADKSFQDFKSKFAKDTDIYEVYKMYQKVNGEQEEIVKPVGSLKTPNTNEVIDFISREQYMKLTDADYDRYEEQGLDLVKIVEKSMPKW